MKWFCKKEHVANLTPLVWNHEKFACDFYRACYAQHVSSNIAVSPYSAGLAVGLVLLGARGQTKVMIMNALSVVEGCAGDVDTFTEIRAKLAALQKHLKYEINETQLVWVNNQNKLQSDYRCAVKDRFQAEVKSIPMNEQGRKIVNDSVSAKTNQRIPSLLNNLSSDTVAMLINTVFFKAKWFHVFEFNNTLPLPFRSPTGDVMIDFMCQGNLFGYAYCDTYSALYLPYRGNADMDDLFKVYDAGFKLKDMGMVIFLPHKESTLESLVTQFNADLLKRTDECFKSEIIRVKIPRFKTDFDIELSDVLSRMGMREAFSHVSDLSGMIDANPPAITRVMQKVSFDINEKGTAAAASTVTIREYLGISRDKPREFIADRPFLYLIREKETGAILFMGQYVNPQP